MFAGALLAILMFASPQSDQAHAQSLPDEMIDYAEGDTAPVEAFTAVDPEGESITWTWSGTDMDQFDLEDGVLKFKNTPDYENPTDSNTDNIYEVTVSASDGSDGGDASTPSAQTLEITILNLEEPGTVDLSTRQPQVANALTATLTDPDGGAADTLPIATEQTDLTTAATWKWERSRNGRTGWTEIEVVTDSDDLNPNPNPDANVYIPVEDDEGYFLRATASYDDGEGEDKTAEMVSYLAVRSIPYSNNTPVFQDAEGEDLTSAERSVAEDAAPGDPVGDPVQATDAAETGPDVLTYTLNDSSNKFSIDSATGQIEVGEGMTLDFDTEPITYTVTVTAKDPSGLDDTINVTIKITDVNETPVVTVDSGTEKTVDEQSGTSNTVETFTGRDEENSDLTWSLSGADSDDFKISSTGELTFMSDPDFEAPTDSNRDNVYEVTAQATDSGDNTGTLDITVTVGNEEEPGEVTLSNLQPEDGVAITAMLDDPDVVVRSSVEWQWADGNGNISGATSATFKPIGGAQVNQILTAKASYDDGHGENKMAQGDSANEVQATDTDNKAPEFKDDNGDALTSVDRSVEENKPAGESVGEPVVAKDERPDGQGGRRRQFDLLAGRPRRWVVRYRQGDGPDKGGQRCIAGLRDQDPLHRHGQGQGPVQPDRHRHGQHRGHQRGRRPGDNGRAR